MSWRVPPSGAVWLAVIVALASFGFAIAAFSMSLVLMLGVHHGQL